MPDVLDAPCVFCGYNGEGYWQPGRHLESCPWRDVGGNYHRMSLLRDVVVTQAVRLSRRGAPSGEVRTAQTTGANTDELRDLRALLASEQRSRQDAETKNVRLTEQAIAISRMLADAGEGPCPIVEAVRNVIRRAEDAESKLLAAERSRAEAEQTIAVLHSAVSDAYSLIDPEAHPETSARLFALIEDCHRAACDEFTQLYARIEDAEASRADAEPLGQHLLGDPLTSQLLDLIRLMPDAQTQVILDFIVDMRRIRAGHRAP